MSDGVTQVSVITVVWIVLSALLMFGFVSIPPLIALLRGHPNLLAISAVSYLFGWCGWGWIWAFIWSLTTPPHMRRE